MLSRVASRGGFVASAALALGFAVLVPAALSAPNRTALTPTPPETNFNLWEGKWRTPYGTLTLEAVTSRSSRASPSRFRRTIPPASARPGPD